MVSGKVPQIAKTDTMTIPTKYRRTRANTLLAPEAIAPVGLPSWIRLSPKRMAKTAANDSWKEMENKAGGWMSKIIPAAAARELIVSSSLPTQKAAKKTAAIRTAL